MPVQSVWEILEVKACSLGPNETLSLIPGTRQRKKKPTKPQHNFPKFCILLPFYEEFFKIMNTVMIVC